MKHWLSTLAAVGLTLLPAGSFAQGRDSIRHGRALVKDFCGDCHAVGRRGRSPQAGVPPLSDIGRTYDLDGLAEGLERGISAGHPEMPEFKFDRADALAVQAYLRSIQR